MRTITTYLSFLIFFSFMVLNTSVWSQSSKTVIKEYRKAKEKAINEFVPFNMDKRKQLYQSMDLLPGLIWGKLKPKFIENKNCIINNNQYLIAFYDLDNDGFSDQFALQTIDKKELNNEFGFIYDLNKDGKTDYIIYNGGLMITEDNPFYHYYYHWIDTDYDGSVDAVVYSIVIYSENSQPDPNKILWVMDTDRNGKPDLLDIIDIPNNSTNSLMALDGIWSYNTLFGPKTINSDDGNYFNPFSEYLKAVNAL